MCGRGQPAGDLAGTRQPKKRGVGCLCCLGIFPRSFPEFLARLSDIENVVDDLKGEAERLTESGQRSELRRRRIRTHPAESQGAGEQRGGFRAMNELKLRAGGFPSFKLEIENLSRDQPSAAGGMCELAEERCRRVARERPGVGKYFESDRQQRVSGKHRDPFAKNLVARRAPAAEVIIVHARQIVMNQGIGMHALDGARSGQRGRHLPAACFRRGQR